MDNLLTAYKETRPLSHDFSEEDFRHHIAKTHPQYRSFNSGFCSRQLHHLDAITASLGWSYYVHERSPPPEKMLYGELSQGKRSQGGQKKRFKDTQGLHEIFLDRP